MNLAYTIHFRFCIAATSQKTDVVLVLGASDPEKLETTKNLAMKIIDMIPTKDTRFAIVQYGQSGMVISEFIQSDNKPVILERIRGRVKYVSGSNVHSGILEADRLLQNAGRPDAKQKIVLFTSGPASSSRTQLKNVGNSLRDKDVKVIVVTVGDDVDSRVIGTAGTDEDVVNVLPTEDEEDKAKVVIENVLKGELKFPSYVDMFGVSFALKSSIFFVFRLKNNLYFCYISLSK